MADEGLIKYNIDGALDNMLAMEEHLSGGNDIKINQWCSVKHGKMVSSHHLRELSEHASGNNPELTNKVKEFKEKFDKAREKPEMDINEIRALRNEFREIIGDKTLSCKDKVCSLDKLPSNSHSLIKDNDSAGETNWKPLLLILGVGLSVYLIYKFMET